MELRLFKPASIEGVGTFQDGGLKHNNPVDLALWECKQIWPLDTAPDVVLSLGTGTEDCLKSPKAPHFRHVLNDGFIPRLCRSFMSSLDGEKAWQDLENRLDSYTKADYIRWNVPFYGEEPRIDDIDQMERLKASVHLQVDGQENRRQTAAVLLSATFYFELTNRPRYETGQYICHGTIRCRNDPWAVTRSLQRLFGDSLTFKTENITLGSLNTRDICSSCGRYSKAIVLTVSHLEESVSIFLGRGQYLQRKISGFPHPLSWFLKQQKLENAFGASERDSSSKSICQMCQPDHGMSKKRRAVEESPQPPKRVRFS